MRGTAAALLLLAAQAGARPAVTRCELTGTVDPGSAEYLIGCVRHALENGHAAVLVRVDTPGGSLEATRDIVQAFLGSPVPVLVWVGPSGARAGSAGFFVALAADYVAMAPGTNIGAAHPVLATGESPAEAMEDKIVNDAAAWAESIAELRGRNAEWSARAVRESASASAQRAVELDVADAVASDEAALLSSVAGRFGTEDAAIVQLVPTLSQRIVHALANPTVAWLLFVVGTLGLAIELANPGLIAPGVIGAVALVLALIAFAALPVHAGALVLLGIGVALIVAELALPSGLFGLGGAVLVALGGLLLVDRVDPGWLADRSFRVPASVVLPTVLLLMGSAAYLLWRAGQARRLPQQAADLGLSQELGRALTEVGREGGEVFVHGERWRAFSDRPIAAGRTVRVRELHGLTLHVEEVE